MDHMLAIPPEVEEYVANASRYLAAASRLPPPAHNAAHILLLIIGWENIVLADKTLSAWASSTTIEARLKRDHAEKLQWVTPSGATEGILHVLVGPAGSGTPVKEVWYKTGEDLARLRMLCQYGNPGSATGVSQLFARHWHADGFARGLESKIKWVEMLIKVYRGLL
jgi:hypothetical protein